ncbi:MAG: VanZ family protein [Clostridium argentinense]|uniref:VanZ family protein n=1 Tax=Clostridium faecium TaxID=2762223 RepID=A0ABR8YYE0_9CLOT|nr:MULTISPECIES: VanZ family protein [Clostridium]MBD8048849.1 VanZ family protein [Clostridium faecium]MBS5824271.1 VanZ family protein [Clostridium argentinense]MDU1350833.1 VanZ family protein [Clostridium argentinense]
MNKKIKWLLLIAWMGIIFWFSHQPSVQSDEQSYLVISILRTIGINFNSIFGQLSNFIIRKLGHFTEYFILSILFYNLLKEYFKFKSTILLSILFVFIYACSDEIHQLFIVGRQGSIRDVVLDTVGGIISMIIVYVKNKVNNIEKAKYKK